MSGRFPAAVKYLPTRSTQRPIDGHTSLRVDVVPMAETTVTVYSRSDCHLCSEALSTIREVAADAPVDVAVKVVDVDDDPDLRERYGDRVPYVLVDGRPADKFRVDADDLRARLTD
jgi:glutaredoxin